MNIQIFGRSKCFDTKKAERYFKERRIKFQSIDLPRYGMSKKEFESVRAAVGLENLIDPKAPDADLIKYENARRRSLAGALWTFSYRRGVPSPAVRASPILRPYEFECLEWVWAATCSEPGQVREEAAIRDR